MKEPKNTLYIYTRVSSSNQIKCHSLNAQKKKGIAKAKSLGFNYNILSETGKSACDYNLYDRAELSRLVNLCINGTVKNIFVTEWDRLSRDELLSALLKKTLWENGVTIYTERETLDFNDFNSFLISSISSALIGIVEKKIRGERIKKGKLDAAKRRSKNSNS